MFILNNKDDSFIFLVFYMRAFLITHFHKFINDYLKKLSFLLTALNEQTKV
jgi:hypothetical protein